MIIDILCSVLLGGFIGYMYALAFVEKQKRVFLYHKHYSLPTGLLRILCACALAYLVLVHHVLTVPLIISFLICFVAVIAQYTLIKN